MMLIAVSDFTLSLSLCHIPQKLSCVSGTGHSRSGKEQCEGGGNEEVSGEKDSQLCFSV